MTEDDTTPTEHSSTSVSRRSFVAGAGAIALGGAGTAAAMTQNGGSRRTFTVRLENVSDGHTLQTTAEGDQAEQPVPLSPVAYAVHTPDEPMFAAGEPARDNGLEPLAEDGTPDRLVEHLADRDAVVDAGAVAVAEDADGPGPLPPGSAYEFEVEAAPGQPRHYLSLVTMFVPSNDLFYALGGETGVPLFDGNSPTAGNVTDRVDLWDAGTEINEEPGVGENQPQRQRGAGVGLVERGTVAPVSEINGYDYPLVDDVLSLQVTP